MILNTKHLACGEVIVSNHILSTSVGFQNSSCLGKLPPTNEVVAGKPRL